MGVLENNFVEQLQEIFQMKFSGEICGREMLDESTKKNYINLWRFFKWKFLNE